MKTNMTFAQVQAVTPADVVKVYSGKPGCMCGCKGNYRVNPTRFAEASAMRGYAYHASDANFAQVKRVVKIVQENITAEAIENSDASGSNWAYVEVNGRAYAFYISE